MDAENLEYFKAALEGRATVGWNEWFAAREWLADLCFEGEMELTSGNAEVGRNLLAVVVQAGSGHDLLIPCPVSRLRRWRLEGKGPAIFNQQRRLGTT